MRRRSYMVPRGVCGAWCAGGVFGVFNGTGRSVLGRGLCGLDAECCHSGVVIFWCFGRGFKLRGSAGIVSECGISAEMAKVIDLKVTWEMAEGLLGKFLLPGIARKQGVPLK